jgi:hypothetical protein
MTNYHNAISDKLIVSNANSGVIVQIYSRDNQLKMIEHTSDLAILDNLIFNETHYVAVGHDFSLVPSSVEDADSVYRLQFGTDSHVKSDQVDDIKVIYSDNQEWAGKLVNSIDHTDIQLFIQYALAKKKNNALYFYQLEQKLRLVCIKDGKLQLANSYTIENNDDLFYFIMLVVEQLEMEAESLYIETVCTKGKHEDYLVLFKNYLPSINLSPLGVSHADTVQSNLIQNNPVSIFLAECVL